MRVYILCLMFLVLVSCGIFSTGSTSHQYVQGNGVAGTKCTSHSNCLAVCTCSTSDNIACEEGTGTCLSTGVCSNRQASGGY
ncbi:MAG: hypothetical protein NTY22_04490 [Proteobacteria bacterium]|nr:hypothetical protein [Pseudomonadota bacterium]